MIIKIIMAVNKNALLRYQALDKCFRNPGRKYSIDDLVDACTEAMINSDPNSDGIKTRQVYKDISFMTSLGGYDAPIEEYKEGRIVYRRYTDLNFTINNQPLNEDEANQLKEALMTLTRFKGMPQFEWITDMITRLESSFGLVSSESPVIYFESNPYLTGLERFSDLYRAIIYKKPLRITSKSFKTNSVDTYELHPYYLKQYNNRWFLFGYNVQLGCIHKKAIDRIDDIQELQVTYIESTIDFAAYFEDVIGVTVEAGREPSKVVLRIDENLWPFIFSKPLHESQSYGSTEKLKTLKDGFVDIRINVVLNYELETKILEHGEKIRVLEPEVLKVKMRDRIMKMAENY